MARPKWLLIVFSLGIALTAGVGFCLLRREPKDWTSIKTRIRREFPDVRQLSTKDLADWLSDHKRPPPLLLDVRTPEEYEVSHLEDARHVSLDAEPATALELAPKDQPIVVYCSVGYRSSSFADKLHRLGFTNVFNLDGSIFQWANEGRPIFHDRTAVRTVHPYNQDWELLLDRPLRADVRTFQLRSEKEK